MPHGAKAQDGSLNGFGYPTDPQAQANAQKANPPGGKRKTPHTVPIPFPYGSTTEVPIPEKGVQGKEVCASTYSGDTCGKAKYGFAELSTNPTAGASGCDFKALGDLPRGKTLPLTGPNGKQVTATKVDVGCGGAGCEGVPRAIDLCPATAQALGVSGLAKVTIGGYTGPTPSDVPGVPDVVGFLKALFSTESLIKIGKVVLGALAVAMGVLIIAKSLIGTPSPGQLVRKAVT